jgi:hypothetical protein
MNLHPYKWSLEKAGVGGTGFPGCGNPWPPLPKTSQSRSTLTLRQWVAQEMHGS